MRYRNVTMLITFLILSCNLNKINCIDPKFGVSARLMECETPSEIATNEDHGTFEVSGDISDTPSSNSEPSGPGVVNICSRKMYIHLHVYEKGKGAGDDDFIVIDEVTDGSTDKMAKLMNPIVVKLLREQPQLVYPLVFQEVVNGGASEEVVPVEYGREKRFKAANCGESLEDNRTIFREGFYCSCENSPSDMKTAENKAHSDVPLITKNMPLERNRRQSKDINLLHGVRNRENNQELDGVLVLSKDQKDLKHSFFFENDKKLLENYKKFHRQGKGDAENKSKESHKHLEGDFNVELSKNDTFYDLEDGQDVEKNKRGNVHNFPRSIQYDFESSEAADEFLMRVDKERFDEVLTTRGWYKNKGKGRRNCDIRSRKTDTAHCLQLSGLYYSVYSLKDPIIIQDITVQVFQKNTGDDGSSYWVDLTRGKRIRVGSFSRQAKDKLPTIAITFSSARASSLEDTNIYPINTETMALLVPTYISEDSSIDDYPQAQGGPGEFLLVPKYELSLNGTECDKVGSSYEAFASQPDRCEQPLGSCLTRQPVELWLQDMDKKLKKRRGNYFLENFGHVSTDDLILLRNRMNSDLIALEYNGAYECDIELELRSDMNGLLKKGRNVELQSVITDASSHGFIKVEILVINQGLLAGHFAPRIVGCHPKFTLSPFREGPSVLISPLRRNLFRMLVEEDMPQAALTCTVEILDSDGWKVASRIMQIKKSKRCLCGFYCSCQCISVGEETSACKPLTGQQYQEAGYREDIPHYPLIKITTHFKIDRFRLAFFALTAILLLGKLKALLGCKSNYIRNFGLPFLRDVPFEDTSSMKALITDSILNMFFFILYPMKMILKGLLRILTCTFCSSINVPPSEPLHLNAKEDRPVVRYVKTMESAEKLYYDEENDPVEEEDVQFVLKRLRSDVNRSLN